MFGNKKRENRPEETEEAWSDVTEYEYDGAYDEQGSWAADDEDEYEKVADAFDEYLDELEFDDSED